MFVYLMRRFFFLRRKSNALREIRRNGWRSPWLGDGRRSFKWTVREE